MSGRKQKEKTINMKTVMVCVWNERPRFMVIDIYTEIQSNSHQMKYSNKVKGRLI